MTTDYTLSPLWTHRLDGDALDLANPATGKGLRLDGAGALLSVVLHGVESKARSQSQLNADLAPLGDQAGPLLTTLIELGVLRPWAPQPPPRVEGSGRLAALVRRALQRGGWRLPDLTVTHSAGDDRGGLVLTCFDGGLGAIAGGLRPCVHCLRLRRVGRSLGPGERRALNTPARGLRGHLEVLVGALLVELERRVPGPGEALLVRPGGSRWARFVLHPDCAHCSPPRAARTSARETLAALERDPLPMGGHVGFTDADLGPLVIREVPDQGGRFPFGAPFVWGSLRLVRALGEGLVSVSTESGIYGKGPDAETCRRLAVSEGLERVATLGVRPDGVSQLDARGRAVLRGLYSAVGSREAARARPWVHGLDLRSSRPVRLPLESVAVGLPRDVFPALVHREPFYSGAASHLTLAQATVHAALELLERDAFMIAWYRRRALAALSWPQHLEPLAAERHRYLLERGFELELFDLRLDLPFPLLLMRATAQRANANWPAGGAMLFASGAFSAARALDRILALACGQFISLGVEVNPARNPLNVRAVRQTARTHPAWSLLVRYLDPARAGAHAFLGGARREFESIAGDEPGSAASALAQVDAALLAAGLDWYLARLTDAPMEAAGFEVAKVVIPGLVGLAPSRATVDLGLERLNRAWPLAQPGLYREPHPLY